MPRMIQRRRTQALAGISNRDSDRLVGHSIVNNMNLLRVGMAGARRDTAASPGQPELRLLPRPRQPVRPTTRNLR